MADPDYYAHPTSARAERRVPRHPADDSIDDSAGAGQRFGLLGVPPAPHTTRANTLLFAKIDQVQALTDRIEMTAGFLDTALGRLGVLPATVDDEGKDLVDEPELPNSETALGQLDTQILRLKSLAAWLGESAERLARVV